VKFISREVLQHGEMNFAPQKKQVLASRNEFRATKKAGSQEGGYLLLH